MSYAENSDPLNAPCNQDAPATPPGKARSGKQALADRQRDRQAEKTVSQIRYSLALPSVGKAAEVIRKRTAAFRRALETAVTDARGIITLSEACYINTACSCERSGALAAMWLRQDDGSMTAAERLSHSKAMLEASEKRDRAVEKLRLPGGTEPSIDDVYSRVAARLTEKSAPASKEANATPDSLNSADASPAFPNASEGESA